MENIEVKNQEIINDKNKIVGTPNTFKDIDHVEKIEKNIESLSIEDIEKLTGENIDDIFDDKEFSKHIEEIMKDSQNDSLQFKIDFLKFLKANQEQNKTIEEFKLNVANEMEGFKVQMDKLVSQYDSKNSLAKLEEAIKITENKEEKEKLKMVYDVVLFSINLDPVKWKIKNKGKDVIKKECKKNFNSIKKKAIKILKKDSKLYMNPNFIENLYVVVDKENEKYVDVILYIIYRFICQDKRVPLKTSLFVSYFILNCAKINSAEEIADMSIDRMNFMNSVTEVIELLK